jgi:hypothetical protein
VLRCLPRKDALGAQIDVRHNDWVSGIMEEGAGAKKLPTGKVGISFFVFSPGALMKRRFRPLVTTAKGRTLGYSELCRQGCKSVDGVDPRTVQFIWGTPTANHLNACRLRPSVSAPVWRWRPLP